jgi:hypothetical protein
MDPREEIFHLTLQDVLFRAAMGGLSTPSSSTTDHIQYTHELTLGVIQLDDLRRNGSQSIFAMCQTTRQDERTTKFGVHEGIPEKEQVDKRSHTGMLSPSTFSSSTSKIMTGHQFRQQPSEHVEHGIDNIELGNEIRKYGGNERLSRYTGCNAIVPNTTAAFLVQLSMPTFEIGNEHHPSSSEGSNARSYDTESNQQPHHHPLFVTEKHDTAYSTCLKALNVEIHPMTITIDTDLWLPLWNRLEKMLVRCSAYCIHETLYRVSICRAKSPFI